MTVTSPLMIEIGLWYHCRTNDFRDGDLSAPAVAEALGLFCEAGLLAQTCAAAARDGVRKYRPTDGLRVWVGALCEVKLPTLEWVIPQERVRFNR